MSDDPIARIDALVTTLRSASWKERDGVKEDLLAIARAHAGDRVRAHLEEVRRGLSLELRWEIDEVLEALEPQPEEPEAPEEEAESEDDAPPDGQIRMSDLNEVYADPRGLTLFTDKAGERWFASQVHPMTGQPMMMELGPAEISQIKMQLQGSPYWIPGSGVTP